MMSDAATDKTTTVVGNPNPSAFSMPVDVMVEKVLLLRDKKELIETAHKIEVAKYNEAIEFLENKLLGVLNDNHAENMRTIAGTFYKSLRTSCRVETWSLTLHYILEHKAYDLLEHRVSKKAAEQVIADTKTPIPGVAITQEVQLNVRRPQRETPSAA